MLNGGFEFDEKIITEIDEKEIIETLHSISDKGLCRIAISGKIIDYLLLFFLICL